MVPTLRIGDHIFVSKFHYGLSIPFTKIQLVTWGGPKRGEIIVFLFPRDESLHYIKRVIGVPGDKIEFRGRNLMVNGEPVDSVALSEVALQNIREMLSETGGELQKETLGGIQHLVRFSGSANYDIQGLESHEELVPAGHYFVMGDNRDDSYDSRSWGFVPQENIKGRAEMIWLSLDSNQGWGLQKLRWDRCGILVQ